MDKKVKKTDYYTIRLNKDTYMELGKIGSKNQTYNEIVSMLIFNYKKSKLLSRK